MQIWKEHLNRDEFVGGQDFLHLAYFTNSIVEFRDGLREGLQIYVLTSDCEDILQ